jgi:hypothetical protein
MQIRRTLTAALLGASLVAAVPAAATAGPGHHGRGGDRDGASFDRSEVPSRVASRLKRAERALDRATDAVDDGNATGAASALKGVRSNLAAAEKAAKKRVTKDDGADSFYVVARTENTVIEEVVSLYDGADDATVAALTETLNAAIDGRDALIAAIPGDSQSDYSFVYERINDDVADEIEAIDEALSDDTLTDAAKADLSAARAKLVATQSVVQPLATSSAQTVADEDGSSAGARDEDCPRGERGGRGPRGGSQEGPPQQEVPQT